MGTTVDPSDPGLGRGSDTEPGAQNKMYLVLSEEERSKGFIRPVRRSYIHSICGCATRMSQDIAETYARKPTFYGSTYCVCCQMHLPVGEFTWDDSRGEVLGS